MTSTKLALGIFLLFALLASPIIPSVSAQGLPFLVYGQVSDEGGNPVGGASVTVTTSSGGSYQGSSEPTGKYAVQIDRSVTPPGSTITVYASKGLKSGSNSGVMPSDAPSTRIDVTIYGPVIVTKTATATSYVVIYVVDAVVTSTMSPVETVYVTAGTETVLSTVIISENTVESVAQTETHTLTEWVNLSETKTLVLTQVSTVVVLPVTEILSPTTTDTVSITLTKTVDGTASGSPTLVQWTFLLSLAAITFLAATVLVISHPTLLRAVRRLASKAGISLVLCALLTAFSLLALAPLPGISAEGQTSTVTSTKIIRITATSHVTSILWRTATSAMTVALAETVYSTLTATSCTTMTEVYKTTVFTTEAKTSKVTVTATSWTSVTTYSTLSTSSH